MISVLLDVLFVVAGLLGLGTLAASTKPFVAAFRELHAQSREAVAPRYVRTRILATGAPPASHSPKGAVIYRPLFRLKPGSHPFQPAKRVAA